MQQLGIFPLNPLDINFLLSSDLKKLDLPNSITIHFQLKTKLDKAKLVQSILEIALRYPELKLTTAFDSEQLAWVETTTDKLKYISTLITQQDELISVEELLSTLIRKNNYDTPFEIIISKDYF